MSVQLTCPVHPAYTAQHPPRTEKDCACQAIWQAKLKCRG